MIINYFIFCLCGVISVPSAGFPFNSKHLESQSPRLFRHSISKDLSSIHKRTKRYALQGSRWKKRHIVYRVSKYPIGLERDEVDVEVDRAFREWDSAAEGLTIRKSRNWNEKVEIEIKFVTNEHGDEDPFDGPLGNTAHAYYPWFGGDIHFDADEHWTIGEPSGINLYQVLLHEIGHSLGLLHSNVEESIMSPQYKGYRPNFTLHEDDIRAIRKLYPGNATWVCDDYKIDAGLWMADNNIYVLKGNLAYRLITFPKESIMRLELRSFLPGLPSGIDAAFTTSNNVSYFFKGSYLWLTHENKISLKSHYPQKISSYFPTAPSNMDAAIYHHKDKKIYFFKGRHFWTHHLLKPTVSSKPELIAQHWKGLPRFGVEASLKTCDPTICDRTYFFSNLSYYSIHDSILQVDRQMYPQKIGRFFGCYFHYV